MRIAYRLPQEFYGYGNNLLTAIRLWLFHIWYEWETGIYRTAGIRILGIEISSMKYKYWDY